MAITASDLVLYGSTGRPDNDVDLTGGGIDLTARPITTPMSSAGGIELISSSSDDARTALVRYRTTEGVEQTWNPTVAGTCEVLLSTGTPEYMMTITMSAVSTTATVSFRVSSGPAIHAINPDETDAFQLFTRGLSSDASVLRYEKMFVKNVSTGVDLSQATIELTSDAQSQYRVGLSATKDSTDGWANRLTDPGYAWTDDGIDIDVPTSTLGLEEAIGVGVEQTLAANSTQGRPTILVSASGGTVV